MEKLDQSGIAGHIPKMLFEQEIYRSLEHECVVDSDIIYSFLDNEAL